MRIYCVGINTRRVDRNIKKHLGNIDQLREDAMASSMQAALHMDPSYEKNSELFKNSEFENIKGLLGITKMVIERNSEIKNVFPADVVSSLWEKHVLLKAQAIKWTKARVYVYSDSVLCLGKQHGPEDAIRRWSDQVSTLKMCSTFRELLHEIQADLQGKNIRPEKFSDRRIFMSIFNDIELES